MTGGGRGIGAAAASCLAREGAAVAVAARSKDEIKSVALKIEAAGGRAIPVQMDVSNEKSVASGFKRALEELGPVTVLVNNAGVGGVPLPVAATKPADWRKVVDVNFTGAFLCAHEALPAMISANWGRIINISSAAARHPVAGMTAYSASKAALDQFTRVLALEGAPYGITTLGVYPGVVDTQMQKESRNLSPNMIGTKLHRMFANYHTLGMLRSPEEPAEFICYLCTAEAERLNGHILRMEQFEALKQGER